MATETQSAPPSLTFPLRVLQIPLVHSSLDTIHNTLSSSPYTKSAYQTSTAFAHTALDTAARVTAPVYPKVLPIVTAADGYANKGLDTLQSRFPYPFESSPETMYNDLKKAPEDARNVAYKTIDERIKTPAYGLAKDVDARLAPLVDLLESLLMRIHVAPEPAPLSSPGASTSTAISDKAQVTRAKELVFGAKDHIIDLTTEQAKTLRNQNIYMYVHTSGVMATPSPNLIRRDHFGRVGCPILIQRAAEQAESINATLTAQYQNAQAGISAYKGKGVELTREAQARVHALSHNLITELEKVQSTTASLPAHIQATFKPLTDEISSTLAEIKGVLTSQEEGVTLSEKTSRVGAVIKERIGPIVEQGKALYATAIDKFSVKKDQAVATTADTAEHLTNGTT
ncbi:SubName: Full=Uncharacterized protein {ECO:0000313/EMBL:CCA75851.1} [Serendipita indica DSM 11827]|nr:SubName: Full=Uncharacterized protein {ECO:0000313/EMBL:CCA75851.1} [Serendipita indica DSM 11827]